MTDTLNPTDLRRWKQWYLVDQTPDWAEVPPDLRYQCWQIPCESGLIYTAGLALLAVQGVSEFASESLTSMGCNHLISTKETGPILTFSPHLLHRVAHTVGAVRAGPPRIKYLFSTVSYSIIRCTALTRRSDQCTRRGTHTFCGSCYCMFHWKKLEGEHESDDPN